MSKFTKEMVDTFADKLLIGLSKEENEMVLNDFDAIKEEMELINNISNLESVEPMTHCLDDFNYIPCDDIAEKSPSIDDLLKNCDSYEDREVKVPKVVG